MPIIYHRNTNTYEDTTPPPPEDLSDPEEYEVISLIYHRQLRRYVEPGTRMHFRKADADLLLAAGAIARIDPVVLGLEALEAEIRAEADDATPGDPAWTESEGD